MKSAGFYLLFIHVSDEPGSRAARRALKLTQKRGAKRGRSTSDVGFTAPAKAPRLLSNIPIMPLFSGKLLNPNNNCNGSACLPFFSH